MGAKEQLVSASMFDFLRTNADILQAMTALVSILAIIPAATIFFINQRDEQRERRESKYIEVSNQYQTFLQLALSYPRLGITQYSDPMPKNDITPEELVQQDILFEILTSIVERAYIIFSESRKSFRREQWEGWLAYIREYCLRDDYLDWWLRIVGEGDWERALAAGASQYDRRFEQFIVDQIRGSPRLKEAQRSGEAISSNHVRRANR